MMYLFDTNIFLEILLSQEKAADCKKVLTDTLDDIFISDFSLHSIGVILFRFKKEAAFYSFVSDVLPKIEIISLSKDSYRKLSEFRAEYNLDFDDSYQCLIAEENGLAIVTMDKDFARVENEIEIKFI